MELFSHKFGWYKSVCKLLAATNKISWDKINSISDIAPFFRFFLIWNGIFTLFYILTKKRFDEIVSDSIKSDNVKMDKDKLGELCIDYLLNRFAQTNMFGEYSYVPYGEEDEDDVVAEVAAANEKVRMSVN